MLEGLQRHGVGGALTGPVARGDAGAVLGHADHLTPGDREIYLALSRALVDLARREQRISERDARTIIERLQGGNGHSTR
jgi:predicted short-subunit dehydrogenase-like oxidoreductase (DUF2520 family)